MTWLTWRQFRAQAAVVFGALVVVAIILAVTGPNLVHLFDACRSTQTCSQGSFTNSYNRLQIGLEMLLVVAPALIGIFWGAPLVARELETGTYRLGWTQSVTRRRWLAVKLGVVGVASVAAAGLLSLMVTWWSSPIDTVNANRFGDAMFGLRGLAPMGYAAFAFALGVTTGLLMRRTLPAMASTLVIYVAARLTESVWVRPHLMTPMHVDTALTHANDIGFSLTPDGLQVVANPPNIPNAWALSSEIVNKAGQAPTTAFLKSACPSLANGAIAGPAGGGVVKAPSRLPQQAFQDCVAKLSASYHEVVTYQPASRFWAFQGIETALFLALALLLAGLCFWWVRRRLA